MRKLMVIAALMCAAVSAQAMSMQEKDFYINIDNTYIYNSDETYYSGPATVHFVVNGASQELLLDVALTDGSFGDDIYREIDMDYWGAYAGNDYSYYLTYTSEGYAFKSDIQDYSGENFFSDNPDRLTMFLSSPSGEWTESSNVPEPTSGLLLLIGMAGLALKRKRA